MMVDVVCIERFFYAGAQYKPGQVTAFDKIHAEKLIADGRVKPYTIHGSFFNAGIRPAQRPTQEIVIKPEKPSGFYN